MFRLRVWAFRRGWLNEPDSEHCCYGREVPAADERATIQLRPGVVFPDWSAAGSPSAQATLMAMLDAAWDRRAWEDYTAAEDAVRRTILELYRDLARPLEAGDRAPVEPRS